MKLIGTLFCLLLAARVDATTKVAGDDTNDLTPIRVNIVGGAALSSSVISIAGGLSATIVEVDASVIVPTAPIPSATWFAVNTPGRALHVTHGSSGGLSATTFTVVGGETVNTTMNGRGIGVFGSPTVNTFDTAFRPKVWPSVSMDDETPFASDTDGGAWTTAAIQFYNVNGQPAGTAIYVRASATAFTEGGVTGFAQHVDVIGTSTVDSVEDILVPSDTPTVFSATAYVAEGTVGDVMEFTTAVRVSGQGGFIHTVSLIDDAGQNAAMVIYFFDRSITPSPDTLPISISEGDMENYIGQVAFAAGSYESVGTGSSNMRSGLTIAFRSNATSIFAVMKTKGTPNYSATDDLTIKLGIGSD